MEQYQTVHADDIDAWIDTLRGDTHWWQQYEHHRTGYQPRDDHQ